MFIDALLDTVIDSLKLLPFLFITYLAMELLEKKAENSSLQAIKSSGRFGPVIGGLLGCVPQCGFSAAASSLYAGRVITMGTLIAIFLSTSDEMLPIFISEAVSAKTIFLILGTKIIIGMISGYLIEIIFFRLRKRKQPDMDIHTVCEHEHCKCEDGVLLSSLKHTVKIFFFIFIFSLAINLLVGYLGEEALSNLFTNIPVVGELIAGLVGLISNCASSVVITELYLQGAIGPGAMMSGLLVGAGVGVLILFRLNKNIKENLLIVGSLYVLGVLWGLLITFTGITF